MTNDTLSNADIFNQKFNELMLKIRTQKNQGCINENARLLIKNVFDSVFKILKSTHFKYNESTVNNFYDSFIGEMDDIFTDEDDRTELKNIFHEYFRNEYP